MGIKCFMLDPTGQDAPDDEEGRKQKFYRRSDNGELIALVFAGCIGTPVGAMWWCDWLCPWGNKKSAWASSPDRATENTPRTYQPGPDGKYLCVNTPGGSWIVDSRCSNCTMPTDNVHNCWIRHGEPPNITVDKNGNTCSAGAGSIQCGKWHGFLRNGELVE